MKSPPRRAWNLLALLPLAGLGACRPGCEGAGCELEYAGALVAVHRGADQPLYGARSPLDASALFEGSLDEGPEADAALSASTLWVGLPGAGEVRSFSLADPDDLPLTLTLSGEDDGDDYGGTVLAGPDLDGDGVAELVVGAPGRNAGDDGRDEGAVYVHWALAADASVEAALRISGERTGARLGAVLAACGDLDGDGRDDLAVGAPREDEEAALGGEAALVLSTRLDAARAVVQVGEVALSWAGAARGGRAGSALACADDLIAPDGGGPDGLADLVIGVPFDGETRDAAGAVYVLAGEDLSAGQTPVSLSPTPLPGPAVVTLVGRSAESWLGWSVATGDLNGDGVPELAAGSPGVNSLDTGGANGEVVVWDGAALGRGGGTPFRIRGATAGEALGRGLAIADVDGDGLGDLLMGAPRSAPAGGDLYDSGALYLLRGAVDFEGWEAEMDVGSAELAWVGGRSYLRTGQRVRTGDEDGDGKAEVVLWMRYDPDGDL